MAPERSRYGLLVSALGAIVLAVSVFLPWYGVSFTSAGIAFAQQVGSQLAAQFPNATLQGYMGALHTNLSGLAGHQLIALSAHQVLKDLNILLLIIAGLGAVLALLGLAAPESASSEANRAPLALLGALATVLVLFRMVDPPTPAGGLLSLSLREGAWGALLGSAAISAGALWPGRPAPTKPSDASVQSAWSELSGWTPET
jgi:hypothetical protein